MIPKRRSHSKMEFKRKIHKKIQNQKEIRKTSKKLVRSESLKWCHKLRRSHSKMELYNIYSHQMAINTHYIHERTIVLYSRSKEKIKKKIEKTNFEKKSKSKKKNLSRKKKSKKNLSATFQIFSKCHFLNFLSHWGGCVWLPRHK